MNGDPFLIIQLRRLGDLILTFPLLLDLQRRHPENPLWVVAQPDFSGPLMPLAPNVTFFPPEYLTGELAQRQYRGVINLGEGETAARFTAAAQAPLKLGPARTQGGLRMLGFWQLYRASLTGNNRHNLFHWADLNRLDFGFPLSVIRPMPANRARSGVVGLFVGASEERKMPAANFWGALGRKLAQKGFKPLLLGGRKERALGASIARRTNLPNFCGKTGLKDLAALIQGAELLITPDTGPMHLADWLGTRVLNISLGNVQPWETGPTGPGHWVAQAAMSCAGCWQCGRGRQYCRDKFVPGEVAEVAAHILGEGPLPELKGLHLFRTGRGAGGLYRLRGVPDVRQLLGDFWQQAFLRFSGAQTDIASALSPLAAQQPALAGAMRQNLGRMLQALARTRKSGLAPDFWKSQPAHSRLLAGFIQMSLQNDDFSQAALAASIDRLALLESAFASLS